MKKLAIILSLILCILSMGCSTIRMKYDGSVTTKDGRKADYRLSKSYTLAGPDAALCGLTAIFLGGYCWYYTVMPTTGQSAQIEADAKLRLNQTYGEGNYTLTRKVVSVESWREAGEESTVNEGQQIVPTPVKQSAK